MSEKIAIIGGGSFGTALAFLASQNKRPVEMYIMEDEIVESINNRHINALFLTDITLPDNIKAKKMEELTSSMANYYIWTVPSQFTRGTLEKYKKVFEGKNILIASKGIEISTGKLLLHVMSEVVSAKFSVLSGPSFAKEIAAMRPTTVSVASFSENIAKLWQEALSSDYFRIYTSDDMVGLEVGGSLKNVIAIATGISESLEFGNNARAGLITRGLAEITRFGLAYGAKRETFIGLSGLGDLVLTCTGDLSRNNQVGKLLAQGKKIEEIRGSMKMVAEGVPTAKAVYLASMERGIDMPICVEVYKIIYEDKSPMKSVKDLMLRPLKVERPY